MQEDCPHCHKQHDAGTTEVGAPAQVVAGFRIARKFVIAFGHGNVSLSPKLDAVIRKTLATPDFHRTHHATSAREQARNLSGGLIWWDRLLGTYLARPDADPRRMPLGLEERSTAQACSLKFALAEPFVSERALGRRQGDVQ